MKGQWSHSLTWRQNSWSTLHLPCFEPCYHYRTWSQKLKPHTPLISFSFSNPQVQPLCLRESLSVSALSLYNLPSRGSRWYYPPSSLLQSVQSYLPRRSRLSHTHPTTQLGGQIYPMLKLWHTAWDELKDHHKFFSAPRSPGTGAGLWLTPREERPLRDLMLSILINGSQQNKGWAKLPNGEKPQRNRHGEHSSPNQASSYVQLHDWTHPPWWGTKELPS